jgi:hypothetical protein
MTDEHRRRQCLRTIDSGVTDYRAALAYAEGLANECVQGMSIVAHNASILEAEKAIAEARGVTKLTRLAAVFVPLAFVTAVFSMNVQQINSNGPDIWWWLVASAVTAFVTWLFFRYDTSNLWRTWQKRDVQHVQQKEFTKPGLHPDLEEVWEFSIMFLFYLVPSSGRGLDEANVFEVFRFRLPPRKQNSNSSFTQVTISSP